VPTSAKKQWLHAGTRAWVKTGNLGDFMSEGFGDVCPGFFCLFFIFFIFKVSSNLW